MKGHVQMRAAYLEASRTPNSPARAYREARKQLGAGGKCVYCS